MNIFQVILQNLRRPPATLAFPERVSPPDDFRGLVELNPARCVGCATCTYVCTSQAISLATYPEAGGRGQAGYEWSYDPGRCTFCGRCVDACPTRALQMAADRPATYTLARTLAQSHYLAYPLCPQCGRPAQPVNDLILARAFPEISPEVRAWSRLCDRCRQGRYQPALVEPGAGWRSNHNGY